MLYSVVLVSAIYQHESAIGIHLSPLSWASLLPTTPSPVPPPQAVTERQVELFVLHSNFLSNITLNKLHFRILETSIWFLIFLLFFCFILFVYFYFLYVINTDWLKYSWWVCQFQMYCVSDFAFAYIMKWSPW